MNCAPPTARRDDFLIIGYGNTLRGDDGAGPRAAEAVSAMNLPGVHALACPLLAPELADAVSQARVVLFVDAAVDSPREVRLRELQPSVSAQSLAHAADPAVILALARDVFGHAPKAWWLPSRWEKSRNSAAPQSPNHAVVVESANRAARESLPRVEVWTFSAEFRNQFRGENGA